MRPATIKRQATFTKLFMSHDTHTSAVYQKARRFPRRRKIWGEKKWKALRNMHEEK